MNRPPGHERRLRLAREQSQRERERLEGLERDLEERSRRMHGMAAVIAGVGFFLAIAMLVAGNYMAVVGFGTAAGLALVNRWTLEMYRSARGFE